jgi:hypothetical protein
MIGAVIAIAEAIPWPVAVMMLREFVGARSWRLSGASLRVWCFGLLILARCDLRLRGRCDVGKTALGLRGQRRRCNKAIRCAASRHSRVGPAPRSSARCCAASAAGSFDRIARRVAPHAILRDPIGGSR